MNPAQSCRRAKGKGASADTWAGAVIFERRPESVGFPGTLHVGIHAHEGFRPLS